MAEWFFHSKCCNAHWDLHYVDGYYSLECASCGKGIGEAIKIDGPLLRDVSCEECGTNKSEEDKES